MPVEPSSTRHCRQALRPEKRAAPAGPAGFQAQRAGSIWPEGDRREPPEHEHPNQQNPGRGGTKAGQVECNLRIAQWAPLCRPAGASMLRKSVPGVPFSHPRPNSTGPPGLRTNLHRVIRQAISCPFRESLKQLLHNFKAAGRHYQRRHALAGTLLESGNAMRNSIRRGFVRSFVCWGMLLPGGLKEADREIGVPRAWFPDRPHWR